MLGIFHADLEFRNTIRVKGTEGGWTYKIIDFDYSFGVKKGADRPSKNLFDKTREIIIFWL